MVKNNHIDVRVSEEAKRKLQNKARELNLNVSQLIEKLAHEPFGFIEVQE